MNEHDFDHVEYVKCNNCGKIVSCSEYYGGKNKDFGECKTEVKNE